MLVVTILASIFCLFIGYMLGTSKSGRPTINAPKGLWKVVSFNKEDGIAQLKRVDTEKRIFILVETKIFSNGSIRPGFIVQKVKSNQEREAAGIKSVGFPVMIKVQGGVL